MTIQYIPAERIIIDEITLHFSEQRESIRSNLGMEFKEDNQIFDMGENAKPISQRRDIYQGPDDFDDYFFLNYSKDDKLESIEIHHCSMMTIFDIAINFEDDLDEVAEELQRYSKDYKQGEGEYRFFDLKIVLINAEQMGGEDNTISYVYCTSDMSHLAD